jgi:hypothetical protein
MRRLLPAGSQGTPIHVRSDGRPVDDTVPTPGRHSWADVLRLVDAVRQLAYDRSLAPDDAMRRIRDTFGEHDGIFDDPDDKR